MSKYNNRHVKADGYTFDSRAEYHRYCELRMLERAGHICDLEVHPRYELMPGGAVGEWRWRKKQYEADFAYTDTATGARVVEDVKGHRTALYKLKRDWFLSLHGDRLEFREIEA